MMNGKGIRGSECYRVSKKQREETLALPIEHKGKPLGLNFELQSHSRAFGRRDCKTARGKPRVLKQREEQLFKE